MTTLLLVVAPFLVLGTATALLSQCAGDPAGSCSTVDHTLDATMPPYPRKDHSAHRGEVALHKRLGFPPETSRAAESYMSSDLGDWGGDMIESVPFVILAVMHPETGMPLPTILFPQTERDVAAKVPREDTIEVDAIIAAEDPVADAVRRFSKQHQILAAGQSMDFEQRNRNKFSGYLRDGSISTASDGWATVKLNMAVTESMGNCPKYITRRRLLPRSSDVRGSPTIAFDKPAGESKVLSAECVRVLEAASTIFLATKHTNPAAPAANDVGLNHRGGSPGFVRLYTDPTTGVQSLVIPDFSGNRLMQSLGNVETDPVAGVVVADFVSGALLHVSGRATNLIDDDARRIMPRSDRLTMITVESARLVANAIPLVLAGPEEFSPYNPPVRYLATNDEGTAVPLSSKPIAAGCDLSAQFFGFAQLRPDVCRFDLKLSEAVDVVPGSSIVLECAPLFPPRQYRHMNEGNRQSLNDDLVRTWTIVVPPSFVPGVPTDMLSVMLRRKKGGAVTPGLFELPKVPMDKLQQVRLPVVGFGEGMRLPPSLSTILSAPTSMLWIAGGIGLTPFITFARALRASAAKNPALAVNIVALVTHRLGDDPGRSEFQATIDELRKAAPATSVDVTVFSTSADNGAPPPTPGFVYRRLSEDDVRAVPNVSDRECYVCGPPGVVEQARRWLAAVNVSAKRLHVESFAF